MGSINLLLLAAKILAFPLSTAPPPIPSVSVMPSNFSVFFRVPQLRHGEVAVGCLNPLPKNSHRNTSCMLIDTHMYVQNLNDFNF